MKIPFFSWRWKIKRLRKRWDRAREKTIGKNEPIRSMAFQKLDTLEPKLSMLEEQRLTRYDKARIKKELEIGLEEVKALLKMKPEELAGAQARTEQK